MSLPWITASVALGAFCYEQGYNLILPLRRQVFIELTYEGGTSLNLLIYNHHNKSVYVFGSFLYCASDRSSGGADRYAANTGNQIAGQSILPDTEKSISVQLDKEAQKFALSKKHQCKISLILDDFHGKTYVVAVPIAQMTFIID